MRVIEVTFTGATRGLVVGFAAGLAGVLLWGSAGATVGVGFSFGFACSCGRFVAAAGCTLERGDAEDVREAGTAETLDPVAEPNPGDANVVNALGGSVTRFIVSARVCVCVCGSGLSEYDGVSIAW